MKATKIGQRHVILLLLNLGACVFGARAGAEGSPDALTLLLGVRSARQQIPPSSLKLDFVYRDPLQTNKVTAVAEFDGELRGFQCSGDGRTNGWSTVFDGKKALTYEERLRNVDFRAPTVDQNGLLLFDPRVLGLISEYAWDQTLTDVPPFPGAEAQCRLVGREEVLGQPAWHVCFTNNNMPPWDLWVDDATGFRVYKSDFNGKQTFSFYENKDYPWLPSRVLSKAYAGLRPHKDEVPAYEKEVRVLQARAHVKFAKDRWGLGGMGLKPQTSVTDRETWRSLGVWDGRRLIPEGQVAPQVKPSVWTYMAMALILLGPAAIIVLRSSRKKSGEQKQAG